MYQLFNTISNCKLTFKSDNVDKASNVGAISAVEYMVESTFGFDRNMRSQMLEHYSVIESHIFRWRSILGDGNCYYRAIIFGFLEDLVLQKDVIMLKKIIVEINTKFSELYSNTRILSPGTRNAILNLKKGLILKILYLLVEVLENNEPDNVEQAYLMLLKCFNMCSAFDVVIMKVFTLGDDFLFPVQAL